MVLGHLICFRFCFYLDEHVIHIPWQRCRHKQKLAFLHQQMQIYCFAKAEVDRILALTSKNAARSLDRYITRNLHLLPSYVSPYSVELPVKKAGRAGVSSRVMPLVLPHELIYSLYHEKPKEFDEVFFGRLGDGQERLDKFWRNA